MSIKADETKIPLTSLNVLDWIETGDVECRMMQVILPKQELPRAVMLEGSSSFHIFTPENALFPIEVTPDEMETDVSEVHPWKQDCGIEVTSFGITTCVSDRQFQKAYWPMVFN